VVAAVAWGAALKVVIWVVVGAVLCGGYLLTALGAFGAGVKSAGKTEMKRLGMTKEKVDLFRRSARIINRLAQITDLDGVMAGDQLSPATRKLVSEWIADYKREIEKP
jgi:hypothetical protein